jgi:hypothetical protein
MTPDDYIDTLEEPRRGEVRALHELIRATAPDLSRKQYISLYVLCTTERGYLAEQYAERLPKANIGKSCVRFKRTEDVDRGALVELIAEARRIGPAAEA